MIRVLITTITALLCSYSIATAQVQLRLEPVAAFDGPWAMAALPQGGFLVTEKTGRLVHVTENGQVAPIDGAPRVTASGQVGLHDVALAPDFGTSNMIYLTWVEGSGGGDLHLGRGRLNLANTQLADLQVIWRAGPSGGKGHPGAKIAFGPDGLLYLTSGDRQLGDPAQDLADARGKILRLNSDGTPASGNPFPGAPEVWTFGHRNPYGLTFDETGRLWSHEMGPRGGDELNLVSSGRNYGWPIVSDGRRYSGLPIPDHDTRPEFEAPLVDWTPVIAPSGMLYYEGSDFPEWRGSLFISGLASEALVRVEIDGNTAREVNRWQVGNRIRDVATDAQGQIHLLEDGGGGRLLRLVRD